jgi:CysZ protein
MWTALSLALRDSISPVGRRALLISLAGTVVLLVSLWLGASAFLALIHVTRFHWLDTVIDLLGSLAALFIAWILFPAMSMLVLSLFLDPVVTAIERTHYPGIPQARRIGIGEAVRSGLRLTLLTLALNFLILPLYFFPVVNVLFYYGLNGYLVGRGYFEPIALRKLKPGSVRTVWHQNSGQLFVAGAIIAFLLSLPLINLIAPLFGAAFMLHLFEDLRRRMPAQVAI